MKRRDVDGLSEIYDALYSESIENLNKAGSSVPVKKGAFMAYALSEPNVFDVYLCENMDNESFLYAAYEVCYNREPEPEALSNWKNFMHLSRFEFRKMVLDTFRSSQELANAGVEIRNDVYTETVYKNIMW